MKKNIFISLIFAVLFGACNNENKTEAGTEIGTHTGIDINLPVTTTTFSKDSSINVLNPDRGLYHAEYFLTNETSSCLVSPRYTTLGKNIAIA